MFTTHFSVTQLFIKFLFFIILIFFLIINFLLSCYIIYYIILNLLLIINRLSILLNDLKIKYKNVKNFKKILCVFIQLHEVI